MWPPWSALSSCISWRVCDSCLNRHRDKLRAANQGTIWAAFAAVMFWQRSRTPHARVCCHFHLSLFTSLRHKPPTDATGNPAPPPFILLLTFIPHPTSPPLSCSLSLFLSLFTHFENSIHYKDTLTQKRARIPVEYVMINKCGCVIKNSTSCKNIYN